MYRDIERNKNMQPEQYKDSKILTEGIWEDGTPWKFFITDDLPPRELATAVFCIATYDNKLVLAEHANRGWEIPGGHIEEGEILEDAIRREVLEETGASIQNIEQFGLKMISPKSPVLHRDNPKKFYPYPHSYVPYFLAEVTDLSDIPLASDISAVKLVGLAEAKELLAVGHNNDVLIDYLQNSARIKLD